MKEQNFFFPKKNILYILLSGHPSIQETHTKIWKWEEEKLPRSQIHIIYLNFKCSWWWGERDVENERKSTYTYTHPLDMLLGKNWNYHPGNGKDREKIHTTIYIWYEWQIVIYIFCDSEIKQNRKSRELKRRRMEARKIDAFIEKIKRY